MQDLFWSQVWRCRHAWPCPRCCWPWRPSLAKAYTSNVIPNYGHFRLFHHQPLWVTHRVAWVFAHGALLLPFARPRLVLCHRCDFKSCCNPVHLFLGTQADNMHDAQTKGWFRSKHKPIRLPDGTRIHPGQVLPPSANLQLFIKETTS